MSDWDYIDLRVGEQALMKRADEIEKALTQEYDFDSNKANDLVLTITDSLPDFDESGKKIYEGRKHTASFADEFAIIRSSYQRFKLLKNWKQALKFADTLNVYFNLGLTNGIITKKSEGKTTSSSLDLFQQMVTHKKIKDASESLFRDQHYAQAIFEACKAIELMAKEKTKIRGEVGQSLMANVFNEDHPILRINDGRSDEDQNEQAGFRFLFMGMMRGVRDPKGHGHVIQTDPIRTLQYLGFADLLARRIDEATVA